MAVSDEGKAGIGHDPDFFRIEELIKGNTFSREEITRLLEILNSRAENELEKQKSSSNAGGDTQQVPQVNEIHSTPFGEKQQAIQGASSVNHEIFDGPVEVGASPIDIARAYMAGLSGGGHDKYHVMSKSERAGYDSARKPFLPSASPKPSIHWPGAILHDLHGYTTPENERWKQRIHDFPRTPYSRPILSKSSTKLPVDSGYENTSTPFQQSQTSFLGQVNLRGETADGYGSVGPIRRIRSRFSSEIRPRVSIFQNSAKNIPSRIIKPSVFEGSPSTRENLEPSEKSGESKYFTGGNASCSSDMDSGEPNLYSSLAVRKILERLNKPTPKEKEDEFQLATAWRRSSPPGETNSMGVENVSSVRVGEFTSRLDTGVAAARSVGYISKRSKDKIVSETKDVDNGKAISSVPVFTGSRIAHDANLVPSLTRASCTVDKSLVENASSKTNHEQTKKSSLFSFPQRTNGPVMKMAADSDLSKNHGTKPSLPSLSISKSGFSAASSGNGSVFTFPVSASSSLLSDLPTPSIMPSSSSSIPSLPTIPSYTFATNSSTTRLVFSFPSTTTSSSASETKDDDSALKFNFGSDKKGRLSFNSFEDTFCY